MLKILGDLLKKAEWNMDFMVMRFIFMLNAGYLMTYKLLISSLTTENVLYQHESANE